MRYRIERIEGQHCHFVNGRKELLAYLKHNRREPSQTSARFIRAALPILSWNCICRI